MLWASCLSTSLDTGIDGAEGEGVVGRFMDSRIYYSMKTDIKVSVFVGRSDACFFARKRFS